MGASTISNEELLDKLDAAFKAVTDTSQLGASVLATEKFDRFVQEARDATVVLPEARFMEMMAQRADIDRVGFAGRVLKPGRNIASSDAHVDFSASDFAAASTATNELIARELVAITSLRDYALRRNIERGDFENTLVTLFGEAAGRDLEEYALLADTDLSDGILGETNGWIAQAGSKLYAGGTSTDFDPGDPEDIFQKCLDALPKRFVQDRSEWRLYAPFDVVDAYVDVLRERGTELGDTAQTENRPVRFKGIPVKYAPGLERSKTIGNDGKGRIVTLQHPDNMVWGVFHEVTIEREREAKARRTDFVLTVEADADYEDENAAVAAFLDLEDPDA